MFRTVKRGGLILCFLLTSGLLLAQQTTIERVDIVGNHRVQEDTIRFYIQTKPGDIYDEERIKADFQALIKLKSFNDVRIEEQDGEKGKIIIFHVSEWPLIRGIEYVGNKSFTQSDILEHFKNRKVGLTVDSQYDPGKIKLAERALKELLEKSGKPLGTVKHEMENVTPTAVKLRFVIDEGPKVRIGKITFTGNKVFSNSKLRDALKLTKERGLISAVRGRDKYDQLKLEADLEQNVRKLYQEHGYIKLTIGTPSVKVEEGPRGAVPMFRKTKKQFYIEIPLVEGDQYRVGELHITGNKLFKEAQLLPVFGMKKGDVLNMTKIRDAIEKFRQLYGMYGYINWNALPEQKLNESTKTVDIAFTFEEDKQFFVHRIEFAGNTKTRDKVLRREFLIDEGDVFNSKLLELSILKLNQLGFFEKIEEKDYEVKPDPKTSQVDIGVKVKERGQQSIGLTGGTSGISGSFFGITYTSNNFRGKGQRIEVDITAGTRTTDFIFSFTDPYFRDTRLSMGLSLFNQRLRFDTFNTFGFFGIDEGPTRLFTRKTTGATLSSSYPLGRNFWRVGGNYTLQTITITDIREELRAFAFGSLAGFAPNEAVAALGTKQSGIIRSQISPVITYNSTDHPLDPKRGQLFTFTYDIAGGPLGGDFNLLRPNVEYRHFRPDRFLSHGRNTLAFRALAAYVTGFRGKTVPIFDRYFSGGEYLIRGFDIRSVSPWAVISTPQCTNPEMSVVVDCSTPGAVQQTVRRPSPVGGDTLLNANFEYRIPIAGPLAVSAFVDAGTAAVLHKSQLRSFGPGTSVQLLGNTNGVLRSSTGAEIIFQLPVINAPFRLIFAYNPIRFNDFITDGTRQFRAREPRRNIQFSVGRAF